jgi:hypothetical protein
MAHYNTLFHDMLKFIPRHEFYTLEKQHSTSRKPRIFTRWNQFVHLMFMQLTGRVSLRDGIQCLSVRANSLYHIGAAPVARSTFADANNNRPAAFFEALFARTYHRCCSVAPQHTFRFKNKLYSLDATVIDLALSLFPWASFRRTKAAIKMHTVLDHEGYLPAFVAVTEGKTHEVTAARCLWLPAGSIAVFDRAFTDYDFFASFQHKKLFFVTRQKKNALYKAIKRHPVNKKQGLTSDQTMVLTGVKSDLCPYPLRRIGYRDPETKKHYVFLTNNFRLSAKTIAAIYKDRWQIELFFRWIKQNLKIKAFIGNSRNAVLTQIYVALIAYLVLCYLKFLSRIAVSLQNLIRIIQLNLFRTCTFQELFEPLTKGPPPAPMKNNPMTTNQLSMCFA